MIGAIIGDIVGSRFEFNNHRSKDFEFITPECFFTDDTVCTMATVDYLLTDINDLNPERYARFSKDYCLEFPDLSNGARFGSWLFSDSFEPYYSFGNGSAMRVSPFGVLCSLDNVVKAARVTAKTTHDHPEGIKGAQAAALAGCMAYDESSKKEIRDAIEAIFYYDLNFTCDEIRGTYEFNETYQRTVPQAIVAFLESLSF